MRILITGSRDWVDRLAVYRALNGVCEEFGLNYPPDEYGNTMPNPDLVTIVHGACPTGADATADDWAVGSNFTAERHPAQWELYGKRAGFVRNAEMVMRGADLCLAFIGPCASPTCHRVDPHGSHGASMCAELADAAGIEVRRVETWREVPDAAAE